MHIYFVNIKSVLVLQEIIVIIILCILPTQLKVGDVVVLPTMGFTKLPYNKEEYYVGPENQVLAKINNE